MVNIATLRAQGHTVVDKKWGYEVWLANSPLYCGKILQILPGFRSSLHYHPHKVETFVCWEGMVLLEIYPKVEAGSAEGGTLANKNWHELASIEILRGWAKDTVTIEAGIPHRFTAVDGEAEVIEFSTEHSDEDVIRLEESCRIG